VVVRVEFAKWAKRTSDAHVTTNIQYEKFKYFIYYNKRTLNSWTS
jgi:hypothetical protein